MNRTAITCMTIAALGALATATWLTAGPLTPPAGPVASSYKTLQEVEPRIAINAINTPGDADSLFKLTQPGSYYLTGNVSGVAGKHGIEIAAQGVTIDLNGFDLVGMKGTGAFHGIHMGAGGLRNISVLNGSVRNWGADGINLTVSAAHGGRVEGVHAYNNDGDGLAIGTSFTVSNCTASFNTGGGIVTGVGSTITSCTASNNAGGGLHPTTGCTIVNSVALSNQVYGINTGHGCTVIGCTAYSNSGAGIIAHFGSSVLDCVSFDNYLDGIEVDAECLVRGNTCTDNGVGSFDGANIHATNHGNRIEASMCIGADRGIDIDTAGNIVIKNTCRQNSVNWAIAANNSVAPIVNAATNAAAINGNTYAGSLGNTDPNANFTY